jgi:hypothetical protein
MERFGGADSVRREVVAATDEAGGVEGDGDGVDAALVVDGTDDGEAAAVEVECVSKR